MLLLLALFAHASPLADAVASGDCTTVLQQAEDSGPWRLARGWCQLKTGDPAAAEATLESPLDGVVGEYARLVLARARLAQDDADGAAEALEGLDLPGDAGKDLRMAQARLAVQRADRAGFERAAKGRKSPELDFLRGELAWSEGDKDGAWSAWIALHREAPVGTWDARALDRLNETGGTLPKTDAYARVLELKKAGRIDDAAALAVDMAPTDASARIALARVFMAARKYDPALAHWAAALGPPDTSIGSANSLFDYALSHARKGDYATAAVVYRRVMAQHPGHEKAVFASYKLGYMAYDEGDCAAAIPLYADHMKAHPDSRYLDEALWFSARCHWRGGELDAAKDAWNALMSKRPKSSLVPGAAYWKARALGRAGDADGEKAALRSVLNRWPTSGYAWFAAARLGHRFEARPQAVRPEWPPELADHPAVRRADALLALGFRDWARAELAPIADAAGNREAKLAAAWAFIAAGDYRAGQKLAWPYCVSPWKEGDPVAQQACTPRPEAGIVGAVAARYDLDPLLPYGIMTAESALNPTVTSPAGARGLMQLMPKEGPRIHSELYADRPYDADDLYSAPYNASMGTAELGMKRQSLSGVLQTTDLPAVVASYNGGETAVRSWLEAYDGAPEFDEFAEDIGYSETRRYVKRVLGFAMAYRWVYGD